METRQLLIEIESVRFEKDKIQQIRESNNGKLVLPVQLQRADTLNANNRLYPKQILMREVEKYQQLIGARNSVGECDHPDCLDKDNNILCLTGWKRLSEISDDEVVATMNMETREIEYQQIEKKIDQPYNGIMYHIQDQNIDTKVTPNHRFIVEDRYGKLKDITAQDIYDIVQSGKNPHLKIPKTGNSREIKAENSLPLHIIGQETSEYVHIDPQFFQVEKIEDFDDQVYCVRVPNGNFYAQDKNGKIFLTGNSATISLQNVSHIITEARWDGGNLMGKLEILDTPMGMIVQNLVEAGVLIGVSSRAVGSTSRNAKGYDEVGDDLQIICWDVVSTPSTPGSWLMTEDKKFIDPKVDKYLRFFASAQNYLQRFNGYDGE
jgi:hypothetical protein